MTATPETPIDWLIEYFHGSTFEHLALDYAGRAIRLSRALAPDEARTHRSVTPITAPGVGFITKAKGRSRYPHPGDSVAQGEPLFAIRRFRSAMEITAPAAGTLDSVAIEDGAFVEFGEPLATIIEVREP